jgi:hypothetical protein
MLIDRDIRPRLLSKVMVAVSQANFAYLMQINVVAKAIP